MYWMFTCDNVWQNKSMVPGESVPPATVSAEQAIGQRLKLANSDCQDTNSHITILKTDNKVAAEAKDMDMIADADPVTVGGPSTMWAMRMKMTNDASVSEFENLEFNAVAMIIDITKATESVHAETTRLQWIENQAALFHHSAK